MAVHIREAHPVIAREAHLVSAQVEAVALVSEEAVSVVEVSVAASKHNKGRVSELSLLYYNGNILP